MPTLPATVVAAGVVLALTFGPIAGVTIAGVGEGVRRGVRRRRQAGAERLRADQLPDVAAALAAGMRAGLSLTQALAYARDEAAAPLADDLGRLVATIELGTPVGSALGRWAEEHGSEDARLLAGVIDLHRRSGGDLPSVLDGVVAALRERRSAQRELRAMTAQARLSGLILGLLPVGFFAFLLLTSRSEMLGAIATPLGRASLVVGIGLEVLAFLWIRRLLEVR
jgi:tight adherence protein B